MARTSDRISNAERRQAPLGESGCERRRPEGIDHRRVFRAVHQRTVFSARGSHDAGWRYVPYYDANRHVCLARRKLRDSSWQFIRFEDYVLNHDDVHNTISVGICPKDGTIHLSFDHHNHPLYYRALAV